MTEQEYYYNVDLLGLLEDMLKIIPNDPRCSLNNGYFRSYIDDLREKLNKIFDEERKVNE